MKNPWHMSGTEGTGQYFVVLRSSLGRLGFRRLVGSYRLRIEPEQRTNDVLLAKLFSKSFGWKQPGDPSQRRYSIVTPENEFPELLCSAIRALCRQGHPEVNPSAPSSLQDLVIRIGDPHEASWQNIFISYRRADSKTIVRDMYNRLIEHFSESTIFRDIDSIPLGLPFEEKLLDCLRKTAVGIVVIGRDWLTVANEQGTPRIDEPNDYVRREIEELLVQDIPVIPCLVADAQIPAVDDLPSTIRPLTGRQGTPIRTSAGFDQDMNRLVSQIKQIVAKSILTSELRDSVLRDSSQLGG